jgi:hypothetical protein
LSRAVLFCVFFSSAAAALYAQAPTDDDDATPKKSFAYPRKTLVFHAPTDRGQEVRHPLDDLHHWDEIDRLSGFVWRLGMVGKTFLQHDYGLSGALRSSPFYRNPATMYPDAYVLAPDLNLPFFDTHTPYAIVEFDQASRQTQLFSFTLSQNVRPWWNGAVYYKRRSGVGAYPDALTDHYNIGFSQRFAHRRFAALLGAAYNQLNDGQNGGVFQDGTLPFEFLFDKAAQVMRLRGASLQRRVRGLYAAAAYLLLHDTLQTLTLVADARTGDALYRYRDPTAYTPSMINAAPFHPYGGTNVPLLFDERWNLTETDVRAGIDWSADGKKFDFSFQSRAHLTSRRFAGVIETRQQKSGLSGQLALTWREKSVDMNFDARAEYFLNNLFAAEYAAAGEWTAGFFAKDVRVVDSLVHWMPERTRGMRPQTPAPDTLFFRRTPIRLTLGADVRSQNPTLMASYWTSDHRLPTLGLGNEWAAVARAGIVYEGRPAVKRRMAFDPDRFGVEAFVSRWAAPVYFNAWAQTRQAGFDDGVTRTGLILTTRKRFGRFYFSNQTTLQTAKTNLAALAPYALSLPRLFGKASVYFKGPIPKIPLVIFAGMDWTYFTDYVGFHFHPVYQIFYPRARVRLPAYSLFDLYFQAQIKTVRFFVKIHHLNEGLFVPGYYTVTHYPMLERTFAFGVKWHFYD